MKLLNLPPELLLAVANNLFATDVNSLILTNHYLHSLLTPRLHKLAVRRKAGYPALSWAALKGYESLIRLIILLRGPSLDLDKDDAERPALHRAVYEGHIGAVRLLLESGADANAPDYRGLPPLFWTKPGRADVAKVLLDHGADVNARSRVRSTRLHKAVWQNDVEMVRLLLERGANIITMGKYPGIAFDKEAVGKHGGLIEAFLEIGGARDNQCRKCLLEWADQIGWGEAARTRYGMARSIDNPAEILDGG